MLSTRLTCLDLQVRILRHWKCVGGAGVQKQVTINLIYGSATEVNFTFKVWHIFQMGLHGTYIYIKVPRLRNKGHP